MKTCSEELGQRIEELKSDIQIWKRDNIALSSRITELEAEKKEWEQAAYDQVNELNDRIEELEAEIKEGAQWLDRKQNRIEALEAGLRHCLDNRSVECEIDSVMIHRLLRGSDG